MRYLKATGIVVASLVVTMLLGLAGCGNDHSDRFHGDRDRPSYERHDNDRHEERREDRGRGSGREGEHG
jgi:hypothetical protein